MCIAHCTLCKMIILASTYFTDAGAEQMWRRWALGKLSVCVRIVPSWKLNTLKTLCIKLCTLRCDTAESIVGRLLQKSWTTKAEAKSFAWCSMCSVVHTARQRCSHQKCWQKRRCLAAAVLSGGEEMIWQKAVLSERRSGTWCQNCCWHRRVNWRDATIKSFSSNPCIVMSIAGRQDTNTDSIPNDVPQKDQDAWQ